MKNLIRLSLVALAINASFSLSAQAENTAIAVDTLETITVTATRTARRLMDSPLSSSVITSEQISQSSADSLADMLNDLPGIDITEAATAGMKRIQIRGEASRRVAILIDGQELTDHSSYGAPILLDPAMIQRIEVIRGTGSVLYGQKALGGVVNFITKKGGDKALQANISGSYNSATNGQQLSASAFGVSGDAEYRFSWSDNDHQDREIPHGTLDDTQFSSDSIMAYFAYNFDNHKIGVNYDQFNLVAEIATGMPNFSLNMPQRDREKISFFYDVVDLSTVLTKVHFDLYQQTIDRQFVQHMAMSVPGFPPSMSGNILLDTAIVEELKTDGFNGQLDFSLSKNHYMIAGFQYAKDVVDKNTHNNTTTTINLPGPMPPKVTTKDSISIENASLTTKALYLQDEWQINDDLIMTLGARQYWIESNLKSSTRLTKALNSGDDSKLVGSIAANYTLTNNSNVRALMSQGYGFPTLLQVAIGATAKGTYINPNPELRAETSDNLELGYRYQNGMLLVDATAFYTDAANYLRTVKCQGTQYICLNSDTDDIYINADSAISKGFELDMSMDFGAINTYLTTTWSKRSNKIGQFKTDNTGLPEVYGRIGVKYIEQSDMLGNYWINAYIRAASDADDNTSSRPQHFAGWGTVNLAVGSYFGDDDMMMVSLEATNLGGKTYTPASQSLIATGRSIQMKFTLQL